MDDVAALPAPPAFGDPVPIEASPPVLRFLARRRSASAMTLRPPGPSPTEIDELLRLAARAPDHGKLFPWRFVILESATKRAFVAGLEEIAARREDGVRLKARLAKIATPPLTIAVVSRYLPGDIPEWEQRLSAGAVCALMIIAAGAMGYGANWITDWYAYDPDANALLGLVEGEKVAGFVHMGTPSEPPLERVRPDVGALTDHWLPR
ncbi:MAG TPA: nitroreductase [Caulobacteraceae bacterium]|nr:nitroreductase [Caulobacteraceae bacterium]